jgi:hypothetical protein
MITVWKKIDEITSELVISLKSEEEDTLVKILSEYRKDGCLYFAEKQENGFTVLMDV